jgi:hypothetical protein
VFQPVPVFTWTGFYAGFNAGYGFGTQDDRAPTVIGVGPASLLVPPGTTAVVAFVVVVVITDKEHEDLTRRSRACRDAFDALPASQQTIERARALIREHGFTCPDWPPLPGYARWNVGSWETWGPMRLTPMRNDCREPCAMMM